MERAERRYCWFAATVKEGLGPLSERGEPRGKCTKVGGQGEDNK